MPVLTPKKVLSELYAEQKAEMEAAAKEAAAAEEKANIATLAEISIDDFAKVKPYYRSHKDLRAGQKIEKAAETHP